jgi:hypothetical protein
VTITRRDTINIPASSSALRSILLDAAHLPDWNPAFSAVTAQGAVRAGEPLAIRVRGVLKGRLVYDRVDADAIEMTVTVPGLTEHSSWRLAAAGEATTVTHELSQRGPLAEWLEPATRDIATLRLTRLLERVR